MKSAAKIMGERVELKGKVWKLGDNINTDLIAPGRHFHLRTKPRELAKHTLEDVMPDFAERVQAGDLLVAGRNFGLGSSREHAALVLKLVGVGGVVAESFARIFFRNAINVGLPVLICGTKEIGDGDEVEIDVGSGEVRDLTTGKNLSAKPLPKVMVNILEDGGLIKHYKKHGGFKVD